MTKKTIIVARENYNSWLRKPLSDWLLEIKRHDKLKHLSCLRNYKIITPSLSNFIMFSVSLFVAEVSKIISSIEMKPFLSFKTFVSTDSLPKVLSEEK